MRRARGAPRWVAPTALLAIVLLWLGRLPAQGVATQERPLAVVDLHADLPYQHVYRGVDFASGSGQYAAEELLRAGVVGVVLPLFIPHRVHARGPRLADLEHSYRSVFDALTRTPPYALPGCLAPAGRVRTWLAFEGAAPLAADPEALTAWVARGVRSVGLVHTADNALASSSGERKPSAEGLHPRGRELVRKAHQLGVAVDVSHASDRALADVLALAREDHVPVIATHSNARSLAGHPRNLSDEQLRGIAATGGVVGVNFHGPFLRRGGRATLADVVDHVRHLVKVMGSAHVAIGSDFEGGIAPPPELSDIQGFQRLARALQQAGLPRATVAQIYSTNALRILCRGEAERAAP